MLEKSKKILHISCSRHQLIDNIYYYRLEKLGLLDKMIIWRNKYEEVAKNKNLYDIMLFHFIDKIDINFILELMFKNPQKKFGFYLHTFYPFCSDWTCLSKQTNENKKFKLFIKNLSFIITQDKFSYDFIYNYFKKEQIINVKIFILEQPIDWINIIWNRIKSNRFRLWFIWNFSYIKWFDTIKIIINSYWKLLNELWIDLNLYTIENPWEDIENKRIKKINNVTIIYNEYDRKKIYSEIDCLLIPSIWNETWPMVLYEAFANKIPVVISNQESLRVKVIDRVDSYVFKTGNQRDLLKWILWIKENYRKVISNKEWFNYNKIENFNKQLNNFLDEL